MSTEPRAFLVEYRIAGLTFRISVQAPYGDDESVLAHVTAFAERLIDSAAEHAKDSITVTADTGERAKS